MSALARKIMVIAAKADPWQVARFLHDSVQPLQGIDSVGGMGFAIR